MLFAYDGDSKPCFVNEKTKYTFSKSSELGGLRTQYQWVEEDIPPETLEQYTSSFQFNEIADKITACQNYLETMGGLLESEDYSGYFTCNWVESSFSLKDISIVDFAVTKPSSLTPSSLTITGKITETGEDIDEPLLSFQVSKFNDTVKQLNKMTLFENQNQYKVTAEELSDIKATEATVVLGTNKASITFTNGETKEMKLTDAQKFVTDYLGTKKASSVKLVGDKKVEYVFGENKLTVTYANDSDLFLGVKDYWHYKKIEASAAGDDHVNVVLEAFDKDGSKFEKEFLVTTNEFPNARKELQYYLKTCSIDEIEQNVWKFTYTFKDGTVFIYDYRNPSATDWLSDFTSAVAFSEVRLVKNQGIIVQFCSKTDTGKDFTVNLAIKNDDLKIKGQVGKIIKDFTFNGADYSNIRTGEVSKNGNKNIKVVTYLGKATVSLKSDEYYLTTDYNSKTYYNRTNDKRNFFDKDSSTVTSVGKNKGNSDKYEDLVFPFLTQYEFWTTASFSGTANRTSTPSKNGLRDFEVRIDSNVASNPFDKIIVKTMPTFTYSTEGLNSMEKSETRKVYYDTAWIGTLDNANSTATSYSAFKNDQLKCWDNGVDLPCNTYTFTAYAYLTSAKDDKDTTGKIFRISFSSDIGVIQKIGTDDLNIYQKYDNDKIKKCISDNDIKYMRLYIKADYNEDKSFSVICYGVDPFTTLTVKEDGTIKESEGVKILYELTGKGVEPNDFRNILNGGDKVSNDEGNWQGGNGGNGGNKVNVYTYTLHRKNYLIVSTINYKTGQFVGSVYDTKQEDDGTWDAEEKEYKGKRVYQMRYLKGERVDA